ncbi:MAG: GNAT family N-acetyltransferase [Polyangiaceae bacterium]
MVLLRPAKLTDAQLIYESWGRYPENFERLTARVFANTADAERYLARAFSEPGSLVFHIVEPGGRVVGLAKSIRSEHRAQLGYVVHQPWRGAGIATEALRQLVAIVQAVPEVSRIWATCALDNAASLRVLEKCGFEREGILKNWVTYPALRDRPCDNYSYVRPRGAL